MVRIKKDVSEKTFEYYLYLENNDINDPEDFVLMGDGFSSVEEILETLAEFAAATLHKSIDINDIPFVLELDNE